MSESLKNKTLTNIGINSITKIVSLIFQAVGNIVLTRILTPADYGIVGFASIFISFLSQFSDLGIGSALIHRRHLEDKVLYTGFTLRCFLGITVFTVAWIIAPLARSFFDNPAIVTVLRILSFSFIINIFIFLPNTLLTKELDFKKISFFSTAKIFVQTIIAIILAVRGFNYWSIVIANVGSSVFTVILVNIIKPVKPRLLFNQAMAGQLFNYGGNIFLSGFLVFLIFNCDNFIIGNVGGAVQLGYYGLAFNWGAIVCTLSSSIILTVIFPTLSNMEGDVERIKTAYLRILEYIGFAGILANLTLIVISKDFLVYVLGHGSDKWLPALDAFRVLCVYGIIRTLLEPLGSVIMALGQIELLRKSNMIVACIEVPLLYPVVKMTGIVGVAVLVTIAYTLQYVVYYPFIKKQLAIAPSELLTPLIPSFVAAVALVISSWYFSSLVRSSLLIIFFKIAIACFVYMTTHGLYTRWKLVKDIRNIISSLQ